MAERTRLDEGSPEEPPLWLTGDPIEGSIEGTGMIAPVRFDIALPQPPTLTSPALPAYAQSINARRAQPFRITWEPYCGGVVRVRLGGPTVSTPDGFGARNAYCHVASSTGSLELPPELLSRLAEGAPTPTNMGLYVSGLALIRREDLRPPTLIQVEHRSLMAIVVVE